MTVGDFLDMCCDASWLNVTVYDISAGKNVFEGEIFEMPDELADQELCSWDVPTKADCITVNVEL